MKRVDEKSPTAAPTDPRPAPSVGAKRSTEPLEPVGEGPIKPAGEGPKGVEAELRAKLQHLEEDRDRLRKEVADLREKHLRARADYDNLAKRTTRESQETLRFVKGALLLRVASLVENFEALASDLERKGGAEASAVKLVLDEAKRLLKDEGVKDIPGKGQPFNYRYHQAVERSETSAHPEGTIVDVVQRGYQLEDEVLRPALVKVAVPPKRPAPEATS